jgi:cytochrome d ubiquinol oxidase subunit II
MELTVLWFILLTTLFVGFFFLEGFDYGVGILLPFLAKNDIERRMIINTIGPVWDGNEVWMITAGGAMFAAFPHAYATMFSGFYLALFAILMALTVRGVSFEFRSKVANPAWRTFWDWSIFFGSAVPALLWGVAVANLIKGIPIDAKMHYVGGFADLLSSYTLAGGIALLLVFTFHGAVFLTLRLEGELILRAKKAAMDIGVVTAISALVLLGMTYTYTDLFTRFGAGLTFYLAILAFITSYYLVAIKKFCFAFVMSGSTIILLTIAFFWGLFPRIIVSSLNPEWNLTIVNASSSPYTLKVMTIAAGIFLPIVLMYEAWSYWVFRHRVSAKRLEY